jgi:ribosome biogenesis GTPase
LKKQYNLHELGWNERLEKEFEAFKGTYSVGRVVVEYKALYKIYSEAGELLGSVSGKMIHLATGREDYPAVGDWVIIEKISGQEDRTIIHGILQRSSKFSRKIAGNTMEEQIIATNIDTVFLCMSLNQNFNLRRLERYITMAWDSGANPVVLLTKADLCEDVEKRLEETREVALGIDIICSSCIDKMGINEVKKYIKKGKTIAFLGSSGVGKSTIINELTGEVHQITQEVSELGDRGKHTTTNRELMLIEGGGIVIDTPGMRELHILDVEESINQAFDDIESFAKDCKFSDCTHSVEPGCAVKIAIENGELSEKRYESYFKLKKEAEFMERKMNKKANAEFKKSMKKLSQSISKLNKR